MNMTLRILGGPHARLGEPTYEAILANALARFGHRLKEVCLYVEDVNGPRGGIDKQCRCILHLRRMPPIVIQDQAESLTRLIHRVAKRASHALSRKSSRRIQRRQRPRPGGNRPLNSDTTELSHASE